MRISPIFFGGVLLALVVGPWGTAQGQAAQPYRMWSEIAASSFGGWSLRSPTAITAPGSYTLRLDLATPPTVAGGPALQPFATNAPLLLDEGVRQEIATPSAVSCAAGWCAVTIPFAKVHAAGFRIMSGTDGLQEALNFAHAQGGTVVLDPDWHAPGASLDSAAGYANVAVHDERAGTDLWYRWSGQSYQLVSSLDLETTSSPLQLTAASPDQTPLTLNAAAGQGTDLMDWYGPQGVRAGGVGPTGSLGTPANPVPDIVARGPWIDVRAHQASGSVETSSGAIAAGSTSLSLANAQDFANGEGVQIVGAGMASGLSQPAAPSVTVVGTGGPMTCSYQIASEDFGQGTSAASPAGTVNGANAGLSSSTFNLVSWNAPGGANPNLAGFLVYGSCQGQAEQLLGIVPIPGYALPRIADFGYTTSMFVTPPTPNGHFYRVTAGGSSGSGTAPAATTANWCTTPGCVMADGSATYTEQPFTFSDFGVPPEANTVSPTVPVSPPINARADSLITTILAGGGTTALSLAGSAATAASGALVLHDDTAALQAALQAQTNATKAIHGVVASLTAPVVWLPSGIYNVSSPLQSESILSLRGGGDSIVVNTNPFAATVFANGTYRMAVQNLTFQGGTHALLLQSPNLDGADYDLDGVEIDNTTDYAMMFVGTGDGNLHLSAQVRFRGRLFDDRMVLWNGADSFRMDHTWIEMESGNLCPHQAAIWNASGSLSWESVIAIPAGYVPGARWLDNYDTFTASNSKLGAENGGGLPCIYNYADHGTAGNDFQGGSITLTNDILACGAGSGPDSAIVDLMESFPTSLTLTNTRFTIRSPFILDYGDVNLDHVFDDIIAAGESPSALVSITCGPSSGMPSPCSPGQVPGQLLPLLHPDSARQSAAAPVSGYWTAGGPSDLAQMVFNSGLAASGGPVGWIVTQTGRAAAAVPRSAALAAGQWYEDPSGNNGHIYQVTLSGTTATVAPVYPTSAGAVVTDGAAVLTESGPAAAFSAFGQGGRSWISSYFNSGSGNFTTTLVTPDQTLRVTRAQVSFLSGGAPAACSTPPSLILANGSVSTPPLTLANGASADDSGPWNYTFAAEVPITLQFQSGAGCSVAASNFSLNVQVQSQ